MIGSRLTSNSHELDLVWPWQATAALTSEWHRYVVISIIWWFSDARSSAAGLTILLVLAALALGVQSSAVIGLGIPGTSTTYLTGTLTGVARFLIVQGRVRGVESRFLRCLCSCQAR